MKKNTYKMPVARIVSIGSGEVMQMIRTSSEAVTGHAKQQGFTGSWNDAPVAPLEDWK